MFRQQKSTAAGSQVNLTDFAMSPVITNNLGNSIPSVSGLPSDIAIEQAFIGNIDLSGAVFVDADDDVLTVTLTASGGEFTSIADGAAIGGGVTEVLVSETQITLVGLPNDINTYLDTVSNIQYLAAEASLGDDGETITFLIEDSTHDPVNGGTVNIDIVEPASFVVTTTADVVDQFDGQTSLREAIALANSNPDQNDITFSSALAGAIISLTQGELNLVSDLSIDGDIVGNDNIADVTISGNNLGRVISISGIGTNVSLDSLTIRDGNSGGTVASTSGPITNNTAYSGGGGLVVGVGSGVIISNSTIIDNSSSLGGGVANYGSTSLINATLDGNTADNTGGAIYNAGNIDLTNVTIANNSAGLEGIGSGGGVSASSSAITLLFNSTISGNNAGNNGGGIFNAVGASTSLFNTIVLGNAAFVGAGDIDGAFTNSGGNITNGTVGDVFASITMNGGGLLSDNGGPVETVLLSSSITNPALDIGSAPVGVTTDALGNSRDADLVGIDNGGTVDAGAVELPMFVETASLVVTIGADVVDAFDGETSLREAVVFANSNADESVITFDATLSGMNVILTQGELSITSDVTIDGDISGADGRADVTISGTNTSRVFNITGMGTDVDLNSLTIANGLAAAGNNGGGIYVGGGSTVTLYQSTLRDNATADGLDGNDGLSSNDTLDGAAGIDGGSSGAGGGAFVASGGTLTVLSSTISGNSTGAGGVGGVGGDAVDGNGGVGGSGGNSGAGAGLYVAGGGNLSVINSTVFGNIAGVSGSGGAGGYAINGNGGNGGDTGLGGDGGGIGVADGGTLIATNVTLHANTSGTVGYQSNGAGGGSMNGMAGSGGMQNAAGIGMQVFVSAMGAAMVTNTIAVEGFGFGPSIVGGYTDGGGNITTAFASSVVIASNVFANTAMNANATLADNGGPVETIALLDDVANPALDVAVAPMGIPATDAASQSRVFDDPMLDNGGPIDAGAFELQDNSPEAQSLVVTIEGDIVDQFDGETSLREAVVFANADVDQSDITFNPGVTTITLAMGELALTSDVSISGNVTVSGNDASRVFNVSGVDTFAEFNQLTIIDGNAGMDNGGGIFVGAGAGVGLSGAVVSDNNAADGGGIFNDGGTVRLTGTTISGNSATENGGGIFNNNGLLTVTASTFSSNSGTNSGGGISNADGTTTLINTTFSGNMSDGNGGGISNVDGTLSITNVTASGNSANIGGGIYTSGGSATLTNTLSLGNMATFGAEISGIYTDNGGNVNTGTSSTVFAATDMSGAGVLASNGGAVQTIALLSDVTNVALDVGNAPMGVSTDATGAIRDVDLDETTIAGDVDVDNGGSVDAGAFELQAVVITPPPPMGNPEADSLIVTTNLDVVDQFDNLTSLREAINFANNQVGADIVSFDSAVFSGAANSLIRLSMGEIALTEEVTIDGSTGMDIVISGDANGDDITFAGTFISNQDTGGDGETLLLDNSRIFNATADVILDSLTLTGGRTTADTATGGAITSSGTVTITNSVISGNSTAGINSSGGAISAATIIISGSTISRNFTEGANATGGGLNATSVTVSNTTISENFTEGNNAHGGGVSAANAVISNSTINDNSTNASSASGGGLSSVTGSGTLTATLTNTTVSNNSAANLGGGVFGNDLTLVNTTVSGNFSTSLGGGVLSFATVTLTNSIVLGNLTESGSSNELVGTATFNGGNIVGASMADFDASMQMSAVNADPATVFANTATNGAGVLGDNGGSVQTIALLPDSSNPALDVGVAPMGFPMDAAGQIRDVDLSMLDNGGTVDAGAFEIAALTNVPTVSGLPSDVLVSEDILSDLDLSTVTVADLDGDNLTVTLAVDSGTFSAPVDGAGIGDGVVATLINSMQISISGSAADINTYLDTVSNIQYLGAADVSGEDQAIITFTIDDSFINILAGAINVDIAISNDDPFAADDVFFVNEDAILSGDVFDNNDNGLDTDPEMDMLSVSAINGLSSGVGTQVTLASGAFLTLNADGTFDYDPGVAFDFLNDLESRVDSFTYDISDNNGGIDSATVFVTVVGRSIGNEVLTGTPNADPLDGGSDNDTISGLGSGDTLNGGSGNDSINGDDGNDNIIGGTGDDTLSGGGQSDSIIGGDGFDVIDGGDENDTLDGGNQNDIIMGGAGSDELVGGFGRDFLSGGDDSDLLFGGNRNDTLNGDAGNDSLFGGSGNDVLNGGEDDDEVFAGDGVDSATGGSGDDTILGGNQNDVLSGGIGSDDLSGQFGRDLLSGEGGNDILNGGNRQDTLRGGEGDDTLMGGSGDDNLFGGTGRDDLSGGLGNDTLTGLGGFDTLLGGAGDDELTGGTNGDQFVFSDGFGNDIITDFEVASVVERIDLSRVTSITSFSDLMSNLSTDMGGNAVITDGSDSITLLGVTAGDLTESDFLF